MVAEHAVNSKVVVTEPRLGEIAQRMLHWTKDHAVNSWVVVLLPDLGDTVFGIALVYYPPTALL